MTTTLREILIKDKPPNGREAFPPPYFTTGSPLVSVATAPSRRGNGDV